MGISPKTVELISFTTCLPHSFATNATFSGGLACGMRSENGCLEETEAAQAASSGQLASQDWMPCPEDALST